MVRWSPAISPLLCVFCIDTSISSRQNRSIQLFLRSSSSGNNSGHANGLALSTANLYSAVQDGGTLFGLQFSNPVDPAVAYKGPSIHYGTANDPMVGRKIGGVNVFGGGLGLYATGKKIVGGPGVQTGRINFLVRSRRRRRGSWFPSSSYQRR